ncbi:hypothetical protein BDV95DRAFT_612931 [Massariosphaeria phaeospora]|uniref:Uncharacterized protein n=1 Tax=Massariosphaeria phaeospora TaxID=100035 RepID=A0A7C8M1Z7_9PLEO|nr:hypothetical protein BDV95DRAFT_612931 [Massariosphaeria phaeospora]
MSDTHWMSTSRRGAATRPRKRTSTDMYEYRNGQGKEAPVLNQVFRIFTNWPIQCILIFVIGLSIFRAKVRFGAGHGVQQKEIIQDHARQINIEDHTRPIDIGKVLDNSRNISRVATHADVGSQLSAVMIDSKADLHLLRQRVLASSFPRKKEVADELQWISGNMTSLHEDMSDLHSRASKLSQTVRKHIEKTGAALVKVKQEHERAGLALSEKELYATESFAQQIKLEADDAGKMYIRGMRMTLTLKGIDPVTGSFRDQDLKASILAVGTDQSFLLRAIWAKIWNAEYNACAEYDRYKDIQSRLDKLYHRIRAEVDKCAELLDHVENYYKLLLRSSEEGFSMTEKRLRDTIGKIEGALGEKFTVPLLKGKAV